MTGSEKESPNSLVQQHALSASKKIIRYKRYKYCDLCKGKMAAKFKTCRLCETLYYLPIWCVMLLTLLYAGLIASIAYLSVYYATALSARSYAMTCSSSPGMLCNTDKGLYCRSKNATSQDYCNCPAQSIANMCDCPSSYYWDGLRCSPVYAYGNGPCAADYTCLKGLTCNQYTGICTCPDMTPQWDDVNKACTYGYKGCYISCINQTSCDALLTDALLQTNNNNQYTIELDECLLLCFYGGFKYTHLDMGSTGVYRCACTNTYNKFSTSAPDSDCNVPCSLFKTSVARCPRMLRRSAFQIGA